MLSALRALDAQQLSRAHQVDAHCSRASSSTTCGAIEELQDWKWNPLLYTGIAGDSVYSLLARDFAPLPDRLRNVRARLDHLPRFLDAGARALDPARVPKIHAETAASQNGGVLSLIDDLVVPQLGVVASDEQAAFRSALSIARARRCRNIRAWLDKHARAGSNG